MGMYALPPAGAIVDIMQPALGGIYPGGAYSDDVAGVGVIGGLT
jgi:hypothetical protein